MIKKIASIVFFAGSTLAAALTAVWLTATGHTDQVSGMLLALWGVFGAVLLSFRLAEGFGPERLSIWAGPVCRCAGARRPGIQ